MTLSTVQISANCIFRTFNDIIMTKFSDIVAIDLVTQANRSCSRTSNENNLYLNL